MLRCMSLAGIAVLTASQSSWSTNFPALPAGWTAEDTCHVPTSGDGPSVFYNGTYMINFNDPNANGGAVLHLDGYPSNGCLTRGADFYAPLTSYGTYSAIVRAPHNMQTGAPGTALFFMSLFNSVNGDQILFEFGSLGNFCALNFHSGLNPWTQQFDLWFDPAAEFFTITITWSPSSVVWTVRGTVICKYGSTSPNGPLSPHFILRPANGYDGTPTVAEVQSASFTAA